MTGTELYEKEDYTPDFSATAAKKNTLERKAGKTDEFPYRSFAGRIVCPIRDYSSDVYPQEPEEPPTQWGLYWSGDPKKALPSVAMSTSLYNIGDCCTHNGHVQRFGQDNNVWKLGTVNAKWMDLGMIEEVMGD